MSDETGSSGEARQLLQSLKHVKVNFSKVVGCVFDTTATNSGFNKGVVVQL